MFNFDFDAATKKTAGQLAVGSGVALLVYNKFERPSHPMGLPLALIGGGAAVLALSSNEPNHAFGVSGPQEEAIKKEWQAEDAKVKKLPWYVGAGAAAVGGLILLRFLVV